MINHAESQVFLVQHIDDWGVVSRPVSQKKKKKYVVSHTDVDEQTSAASDVQWYIKPHKKNRARSVYKKWSFALRISSVNVTKSAVSCGFGQIY